MDETIRHTAHFAFYDGLNDFLPHQRKSGRFSLTFEPHQSIKQLIESLGIPHTEIGRIAVNENPTAISSLLSDGDTVDIYPADEPNAGVPRFVLDVHLGQLAAYLRMLGFDALYQNDYRDDALCRISNDDDRILLTGDRHLLMRKIITRGYCIRSSLPEQQIVHVLRRYHLTGQLHPFHRCIACNDILRSISKQEILHRLEPRTKMYYDEFRICPSCDRIYWKGSHFTHMTGVIQTIEEELSNNPET